MLGRTARFLRLLGFDTSYNIDYSDDDLLKVAAEEHRTLLTRDVRLYERAVKLDLSAFLIRDKSYKEGIADLVINTKIELNLDSATSRCATCNAEITRIPKAEVKGKIPDKTYARFDEFWICTNKTCGKIYYFGTHWDNISKTYEDIQKRIADKRNNF
jgi:uncharacterized protein with PIN domain